MTPRSPVWPWAWCCPQEPGWLPSRHTAENNDLLRVNQEPTFQQKEDRALRHCAPVRGAGPPLRCKGHAMPGQQLCSLHVPETEVSEPKNRRESGNTTLDFSVA